MLKLILPLTTTDANSDRKDVEPLALLVHPQQPLSYLERLVQSELPLTKDPKTGRERMPNVWFRAEDSMSDTLGAVKESESEEDADRSEDEGHVLRQADSTKIDGKTERTGKLSGGSKDEEQAAEIRGGPGEGGVESYSGLGQEAKPSEEDRSARFVRWSSSTEIGDFIRDAARGREFAVEIEGAPNDIRVGVPSFNDRTYYLRSRLRKKTKEIADMTDIKRECDQLAQKSAKNVALGGFGLLVGWWVLVYKLTFGTDLGWDVMEPVTVGVLPFRFQNALI